MPSRRFLLIHLKCIILLEFRKTNIDQCRSIKTEVRSSVRIELPIYTHQPFRLHLDMPFSFSSSSSVSYIRSWCMSVHGASHKKGMGHRVDIVRLECVPLPTLGDPMTETDLVATVLRHKRFEPAIEGLLSELIPRFEGSMGRRGVCVCVCVLRTPLNKVPRWRH